MNKALAWFFLGLAASLLSVLLFIKALPYIIIAAVVVAAYYAVKYYFKSKRR